VAPPPPITHVAVVSTGVIGAAWAACFLARGLDVTATDPAPGAEQRLRAEVARDWPVLERLGLADGASPERLAFSASLEEAVADAGFVQENGPEREDVKQALFRAIDAATSPDVVLASSSSGLLPSRIQAFCERHPERVVVGHPFNPAHLVPLVEVVGGQRTDEAAIRRALEFYAAIGKRPIRLRTELPGHLANRLQAALWREAYALIDSGAATVADIDAAIAHGPGLRWALLGPLLLQHLSGGEGGLAHVLEHLGPPMEEWWRDMRTPGLTPELRAAAVAGVQEELAGIDVAAMVAERDAILIDLLAAKAAATHLPRPRGGAPHMSDPGLRVDVADGVATVHLARPERRNALSEPLVEAIGDFFAAPPDDVRAALIVGDGDHFCAGLDLGEHRARTPFEVMHNSQLWHRAFAHIEHGRIPVVSALHGAVIGGGLELAISTHVRVADDSAFYALPEGRLGIFVGGGASVRVARVVGPDRMRELMLTGRRLSAEDGQRLGLSHELVGRGEAPAVARELAGRIAANAPLTNQLILAALPHIGDMVAETGLWAESLAAALVQTTDDAAEGLRAFLEKREPRFRGR